MLYKKKGLRCCHTMTEYNHYSESITKIKKIFLKVKCQPSIMQKKTNLILLLCYKILKTFQRSKLHESFITKFVQRFQFNSFPFPMKKREYACKCYINIPQVVPIKTIVTYLINPQCNKSLITKT